MRVLSCLTVAALSVAQSGPVQCCLWPTHEAGQPVVFVTEVVPW